MPFTETFRSVLWNDGEDITFGDLNDAQGFLAARLNDQVLARLAIAQLGADQEFEVPATTTAQAWAYALTVGGGRPKQGSANNKINVSSGTLFQKLLGDNGFYGTFAAFTFLGADEVVIANGDAAHPRVDLVQMQLAYIDDDLQARDFQDAVTGANTSQNVNKKHQVQCTLTVKQGVPAAAPAYPVADAGTVPICAVVVPTNYAAGGAFIYAEDDNATVFGVTHPVIHDLRIPLGARPITVMPDDFAYDANWAVDAGRQTITSTAAGTLFVICPALKGRVFGCELISKNAAVTCALLQVQGAAGGSSQFMATCSGSLPTVGGAFGNRHIGTAVVEVGPNAGDGTGPTVSGNGTHAPPIWAAGLRCPKEKRAIAGGDVMPTRLALIVEAPAAGVVLGAMVFYVAEGL